MQIIVSVLARLVAILATTIAIGKVRVDASAYFTDVWEILNREMVI
jgi:hypothetical protein